MAAAGALALLTGCDREQPWSSALASVASSGSGSGTDHSQQGVISPDGTKVAFLSKGSDFGPTDSNDVTDIYLRDLETGVTSLVSVNMDGTDAGDQGATDPVFSPDSTKVAFASRSSDLVADDPINQDVYIRDLASGTTSRVSTFSDAFGNASSPVFRPDGTEIAFTFDFQIYIQELETGSRTLVSATPAGQAGNAESGRPVFSSDGAKIAFTSWSTDLVPQSVSQENSNVYVRDLGTGTTSLVSIDATGTASGHSVSDYPVFSPDGTKVAFLSWSSNLGPTDTNGSFDVYVRDLTAATTTLVSANAAGTNSGNDHSGDRPGPIFTPDGDGVLFASSASDLGPSDTNGRQDIYHRDLTTGVTTLVSVNASGTRSGNGESFLKGFAGSRVLFTSSASDLGPTDSNGKSDVYLRDLTTGVTTLVSVNSTKVDSGNGASNIWIPPTNLFSADGMRVVYESSASDLGGPDANPFLDVYVGTLESADLGVEVSAVPEPVASGARLTYRMDLVNGGPATAEATTAALLLPEGTAFDDVSTTAGSCSPPTAAEPRLVKCSFDDAGVGEVGTVTVTADVTAAAGAELTVIAGVSSSTVDEVAADNKVEVVSTVS